MVRKVYNIAFIATSVFVFIAWTLTQSIEHEIFENGVFRYFALVLINLILAYGFFNMFANIVIFLSNRIKWVKSVLFNSLFKSCPV